MDILNLTAINNKILSILSKVINFASNGSTAIKTTLVDSSGTAITSLGGSGSSSTTADYKLAGTYASTSTLTISPPSNLVTNASQLVYIRQTTATNATNTYVNGSGGYSFGYIANTGTITIYYNLVALTSLLTTDVYEVGVNTLINNLLSVTANSPMPLQPNYCSPIDFTVAYYSSSALLCTPLNGMPDIDSANMNIVSLIVHTVDGKEKKYLTGNDNIVITTFELANVVPNTSTTNYIRVYQNGVLQTPFTTSTSADIKYRVSLVYQTKGYDASTDTNKVTVQNYPFQPIINNIAAAVVQATNVTAYYPSSDGLVIGAYTGISLTGTLVPSTTSTGQILSIEVCNADDTTVATNWHQIYFSDEKASTHDVNSYTVTTAASGYIAFLKNVMGYDKVRVKYVTHASDTYTATITLNLRLFKNG